MTTANLFPDTALLLAYQALDTLDWEQLYGVDRATVVIAPSVLRELSRLKNQVGTHPDAERAAALFEQFVRLLSQGAGNAAVVFKTVQDPRIDFVAERLDPANPRDQLVATIIDYQQNHALEYVVLLSDDPETIIKAERAGIDISRLPAYLHLSARNTDLAAPSTPSGDGIATRTANHGQPEAINRILPLDRLATAAPLYPSLPEPRLPSLPPLPVARQAEPAPDAFRPQTDVETPTFEGHETDSLPVSSTGSLPEAIVQVRLPSAPEFLNPRPAPEPPAPPAPEPPARPAPEPIETPPPARPAYVEMFSHEEQASEPGHEDEGPSSFTNVDDVPHRQSPRSPSLTRSAPELRLAFNDGTYRATALIRSPLYPSIEEITHELTRVRKEYPKLAYMKEADAAQRANGQGVMPLFERMNERIKRYNAALDAYYAGIEKYLHDASEHGNMQRRTATLELSMINDAPLILKSLYITLRFPAHVRIFADDNVPDRPVPPSPPARPNLDALFDTIRLPSVPVPSELRQSTNIVLRSRSLSPLEIRWNKGWDVIYSLRELERNHAVSFNPLYLVFNSFDEATSIRMPYRITVASSSQEERGQLELLVRKVIQ
ncbi:MAG: PIN domain-containing protein [Rhodothermales bacterium]